MPQNTAPMSETTSMQISPFKNENRLTFLQNSENQHDKALMGGPMGGPVSGPNLYNNDQ